MRQARRAPGEVIGGAVERGRDRVGDRGTEARAGAALEQLQARQREDRRDVPVLAVARLAAREPREQPAERSGQRRERRGRLDAAAVVQRDPLDPAVHDRVVARVDAHELGHRQAPGDPIDRGQLVAERLRSSRVVTHDHHAAVREHHAVQRVRQSAVDGREACDPAADDLLELVAADRDQRIDAGIDHGGLRRAVAERGLPL